MTHSAGPSVDNQFWTVVEGERLTGPSVASPLTDPATGQVWGTSWVTEGAVDAALAAAERAYATSGWAELPGWKRAEVLRRIAEGILQHRDTLAALETKATGKPFAATVGEIEYSTRWLFYYAGVIEQDRDAALDLTPTKSALIRHESLGVVAAITPFNGAFSLGIWKIVPALAAGNAVVVKPPLDAPGSSVLLAAIALASGLPAGQLTVVLGDVAEASQLVNDPRVALVSFTGSTATAKVIGAQVASRLGKFVCEAGGKSAHIVLDDADLASAVTAAVQGVFSGTGQTCVAGSRLYVQEAVYSQFLEQLKVRVAQLKVGDPERQETHLGPLANANQLRRVRGFIDRAVQDGATLLVGGGTPAVPPEFVEGFWVEPTVFINAAEDSEIGTEEVFGPVLVVHKIVSLDEALMKANNSSYGLAAGIWTSNQTSAHHAQRTLQAGTVWINTYRGMDWRTPFGGYKASGYGRENGIEGLREFQQVKTVVQDYCPAVDPFGLA